MKKRTKKILLTCLAIMAIIMIIYMFRGLSSSENFENDEDAVYIALIGPLNSPAGEEMLKGAELCVDKINKKGGIEGRSVILLHYDDRNDRGAGMNAAYQVINENKVMVVIGHYYSFVSVETGKAYKKSGIPAITPYASAESVTAENEWYFSTAINNPLQAAFIINYISKILKKTSASIIFNNNEFGSSLARAFEKGALKSNIKIIEKWEYSTEAKDTESQIRRITEELRATKDPGIIFLAAQSTEAPQIVASIKYPGTNYSVIGSDALSSTFFFRRTQKIFFQGSLLPRVSFRRDLCSLYVYHGYWR